MNRKATFELGPGLVQAPPDWIQRDRHSLERPAQTRVDVPLAALHTQVKAGALSVVAIPIPDDTKLDDLIDASAEGIRGFRVTKRHRFTVAAHADCEAVDVQYTLEGNNVVVQRYVLVPGVCLIATAAALDKRALEKSLAPVLASFRFE